MKSIWIYLLLLPLLLLQKGTGRIVTESIVIVTGIAIPIQLAIYAIWKLEAFRHVRATIARTFYRLPMGLGFCLLVIIGMGAIFAVIMLVQRFVCPADSWVSVMLGFLLGVMGPVFYSTKRQNRQREQDVHGNTH